MAPFAEKDEILVTARVWHRHPPKARPEKAKKAVVEARRPRPPRNSPHRKRRKGVGRGAADPSASGQGQAGGRGAAGGSSDGPAAGPVTGRRAGCPAVARAGTRTGAGAGTPARRAPMCAKAGPETRPSWSAWPTDRNRTPRALRKPVRRPKRISALRGLPRHLRPRRRRPGHSRSPTTPIPASAGWARRRRHSARHPGRRPRSTCFCWSACAPSRLRSRKPVRSPTPPVPRG